MNKLFIYLLKYIFCSYLCTYSLTGHFLRIRQWGGGPYYTKCGEMIDGCWCWLQKLCIAFNSGGSGGVLPEKIFLFFYPYDCNSWDIQHITLWCRYTEPSVKYLHGICLCTYHNFVTQGAGLINLENPTATKRHHGWHRAANFEHFVSLNCRKWHFQTLFYLFC